MIGIGVLVFFFCIALAYLGYRYMEDRKDNNTVNTSQEDNTQKTKEEAIEDVSKNLDNEVDNIVKEIEQETVNIDFEDFDSELEFGIQ